MNVTLWDDGTLSPPLLVTWAGGSLTCPPPPPVCTSCNPISYNVYNQVSAFAPSPIINGIASCPPADPPGDVCPPSVGNPVQLWVSGFAGRPTQRCGTIAPFWDYSSYTVCLRWQRFGSLVWDYDDERVDRTTGAGKRVWGDNYGVQSGVGFQNAPPPHVFDYDSKVDFLRNCVRPCAGDGLGPPLPGYPQGSPAFQVQVSSYWNAFLSECWTSVYGNGGNCNAFQYIDLTTLGSPTPYLTAGAVVAVPVVSYGAVG